MPSTGGDNIIMYATLLKKSTAENKKTDKYLYTPVLGTKIVYRGADGHFITASEAARLSLCGDGCFMDAMRTMDIDDPLVVTSYQSILSPGGTLVGVENCGQFTMTGTQWRIDDVSPCVIKQKSRMTTGAIMLCTYKSNNLLSRICGKDGDLFIPVRDGVYACSLTDVNISMQMLCRIYDVDALAPSVDVYYYNTKEKTLGIVDNMREYVAECDRSGGIVKPRATNKHIIKTHIRCGEQYKTWMPVA